VKEFWVYTALRVGLFIGSAALVFAVWALAADQVPVLWVLVIAFVISGFGSYFLLNRPREAFARRVDERARRASARFEEMKSREDVD